MRRHTLNLIGNLRAALCPRLLHLYLLATIGEPICLRARLLWRAWWLTDGACIGAQRLAMRLPR